MKENMDGSCPPNLTDPMTLREQVDEYLEDWEPTDAIREAMAQHIVALITEACAKVAEGDVVLVAPARPTIDDAEAFVKSTLRNVAREIRQMGKP